MMTKTDKRDRSNLFRERLSLATDQAGSNQSALARAVGVDRSTISQLLAGRNARLPNAQVVAECARVLGVSADWLLGLTDRPERPGDVLAASLVVTEAARSSADQQITEWHREAAGYKIRHVPATLPDILKTRDMLRWEYGPQIGRTPDQAIGAADDQLDWFEQRESDYEIAFPRHEIDSFARAEGYYTGLSPEIRLAQIDHLQHLYDAHFPSMRIFLFDARRVFSAPLTVFGPLLAVVYLGQNYLAFRESSRVRIFTQHFDNLVRDAVVDAREMPQLLAGLRAEIA
ncbi:MAG: helix-turn-helix domain-containing protein [Rhodobacteraceae bacterium]|nr:helix-turn-helix domain-containing protein [Paracoccaceae bacterium]